MKRVLECWKFYFQHSNTLFICSAVFSTTFNGFQQTMLKTCFQHQTKQSPHFLLNFFEKNSKKYLTNLQKYDIIEGDKSGIGRETKKDCYQLNQSIRFYLDELLEMGFIVDFADSKIIHVVRDNGFHEIGYMIRKGV